jgi:hypothetical protein
MNDITTAIVTIATGIIGVALLAVLVSQRANTAGVLSAATGPVTGSGSGMGLSMPFFGASMSGFSLPGGGF